MFISQDDVHDIYAKIGLPIGRVSGRHFEQVYQTYLKDIGLDFDKYFNQIVFISCVYESGDVLQFTDDVIVLWLNNKHYDIIPNLRIFNKNYRTCFKYLKYFNDFEFEFNHVYKLQTLCRKCCPSLERVVELQL